MLNDFPFFTKISQTVWFWFFLVFFSFEYWIYETSSKVRLLFQMGESNFWLCRREHADHYSKYIKEICTGERDGEG